jgi:gliding motility-associated-like protein
MKGLIKKYYQLDFCSAEMIQSEESKSRNLFAADLLSVLSRKIIFTAIFLLTAWNGYAATITSTATGGVWNVGGTWLGGVAPAAGDDVIIAAGASVTVPSSQTCRTLTINGNLQLTGTAMTLTITNNSVMTLASGSNLLIGSGNTLLFSNTSGGAGITNNGGTIASSGTNGSDGGTIQTSITGGGAFTIGGSAATTINNLKFVANATFNISGPSLLINGTFTIPDNNWAWNGSSKSPIYGPASTLYINRNGQGLNTGNPLDKAWSVQTGTIGVTPGYPNNVTLVNMGTSNGSVNVPPNVFVGWQPSGTIGLNGALRIGDGTLTGLASLNNVTNLNCGGIIVDNNSTLVGPAAGATCINRGNFTLQGATTGLYYQYGATMNFAGTGTIAAPQIISTTAATAITFPNITVSNGTYVLLNDDVNIPATGVVTLGAGGGIIGTSATNSLTVANTSNTAVTGGAANAFIDGPLIWSLAAGATNYTFPLGSGVNYLPLVLNKVASSAVTSTAQAFGAGSGGTVDATMSSLSSTEYWSFSTSASLPAGSVVSLSRPAAIAPFAYIAESKTTAGGSYTSLAGTVGTFGISNSNDIGAGSTYFFTFGTPPIVSTLAATSITTTSATLNGAFNTGGSAKTTSFSYGLTTAYGTTVNTIHTPINSSSSVLDSQFVTGLTANTIYHYSASDVTDQGSDVVFITAPNSPIVGAPNTPTSNGFTATWAAPAAMGSATFTYTVEVSTSPSFTTIAATQTGIASGTHTYTFNTLSSATQYFYRVRAVNATASSAWSDVSAPVSTLIVPTVACTTGNGSPGTTGTISSAASAPIIDGSVDAVWATVPSNNITQKIGVADEGSGLQGTPNNSATWKTIWDPTYLYILVQVQDANLVSQGAFPGATNISTLNGTPNLWDSDGIEFYLDGGNEIPSKGTCNSGAAAGSYDNKNDFQLRFNIGSGTITGFPTVASGDIRTGTTFNMSPIAGGYLLEARIPWGGPGGINSNTPYPTIAVGNKIGIDFSINDNDNTAWRTAQQGWYDGAGTTCAGSTEQYHVPLLFGTATLATCPQPPTVILPTVTNITATGATLGATVTSSGDSPLSARGTGFTDAPVTDGLSNAIPEGGTGVSVYSGPARTGMAPQTKHYYLGYATNTNGGTGVSTVNSFYTLSALPTQQPSLSSNACTQMNLNWTSITFPPVSEATQTGYLLLRSTDPAVPSTAGIATRVATTQGALAPGTTLVATIPSGSTLTYTDATATAGIAYNYVLVPFTWDGVTADSTYNYFTASPATITATIGTLAAPSASATQQPNCTDPTGTITINPWDNTLTYSIDGTNFVAGPTFSGLTANTYNVVAKKGTCVSASTSVIISPVAALPAPSVSITQPTCTTPTGTITVSPWDNTLTYSIDGTNFVAGPDFTGLAPSTSYNVTAKNGTCVSSSTPAAISAITGTIAAPSVSITQPTCTTPTGTITINPWDNTLTYSIDGTNFLTGPDFSGLAPSTSYNVTAKNATCVSSATPAAISAITGTISAPLASASLPTCTDPTSTITINPWNNTLTYSIDGTNYVAGPTFTGLTPSTTYNITAKNANCTSSATQVITSGVTGILPSPLVSVSQPNCGNSSIGTITINSWDNTLTYSVDGINFSSGPNFNGLGAATYDVIAKNAYCTSLPTSATILVVAPCVPLFIPNLITPNSDGKNDQFEILGLPSGSELTVFNRWGNRVYESNDYDNLWAGNNIGDGVYYYGLKLPDGKEYNGWLQIVR